MRRVFAFLVLAFTTASCVALSAGPPMGLGGETGELPTLAPLVKKVAPGVVNIFAQSRIAPIKPHPLFWRFFNSRKQPEEKIESIGSGIVIDAGAGLIVTTNHVIEDAQEITLTLADGRRLQAQRIGGDAEIDIALVKVSAEGLTAIPFGDSDRLEVGDFVLAIGNPFHIGQSVTSGIVSGLRRSGLGLEQYEDFIQTDARIEPGSSGGALVNLRGELVGINAAAIFRPDGRGMSIGFAIPANLVPGVVDQLRIYGDVRRGRLGLTVQDLTSDLARDKHIARHLSGVLIGKVEPGSPAEQAGLKVDDVITAVGGAPVSNMTELRNKVGLLRAGDGAEFTISRDAQSLTIRTMMGAREKDAREK
jgi:serine protease DegQ